VIDLSWVHKELAPYYSDTGRPSIDPVLMIPMLIVGYVFALRSERRICAEVQVNLAYRWLCKLGIEDRIPDHSVFCCARHERFRESDALRRVFEGWSRHASRHDIALAQITATRVQFRDDSRQNG
jgi:transposase